MKKMQVFTWSPIPNIFVLRVVAQKKLNMCGVNKLLGATFHWSALGNKSASEPKFTAFTYGTRWAPARRSRGSLRARPGGCCSASRKNTRRLNHNRPPHIRAHKLNYPLIAPFSHHKVDALAARLPSQPFAAQWLQKDWLGVPTA